MSRSEEVAGSLSYCRFDGQESDMQRFDQEIQEGGGTAKVFPDIVESMNDMTAQLRECRR